MVHNQTHTEEPSNAVRTQPTDTKSRSQINCESKGGTWDNNTKTCTLRKFSGRTGFQVEGKPVSKEEFQRVRAVSGSSKGSGGQVVTEEDRLKAGSFERSKQIQQAQELVNVLPGQEPVVGEPVVGEPVVGEPLVAPVELPAGITQEDIDNFGSLEAAQAAAGGIIPVEPFDLVGGFGKGVLASIATLGTRGLAKAGAKEAPSLIKEGQGVLKSPVAIRKITKGLKERLQAGAALGGAVLTGAALKAFTGADIAAIEQEVTKYGEQLTKIPEAAKQGLSLDNGELVEYTIEDAFIDVEDIITTLETYQDELQRQGIGNAILRLTGRYDGAQIEIDKQLREASLTQGKLIQEQLTPTQSRLDAQEIFRLIELEGLVRE